MSVAWRLIVCKVADNVIQRLDLSKKSQVKKIIQFSKFSANGANSMCAFGWLEMWYEAVEISWKKSNRKTIRFSENTHKFQIHDDAIKWKYFPRYWPFVRGIHPSRWIPLTKWRGALMFSLICAWSHQNFQTSSLKWKVDMDDVLQYTCKIIMYTCKIIMYTCIDNYVYKQDNFVHMYK